MTTESDSLLKIVEDTAECFRYFQELGVDGFDSTESTTNLGAETVNHHSNLATVQPLRSARPTKPGRVSSPPQNHPAPQDFLFEDAGPAATSMGLASSTETLEEIWADIGDCTRCVLCEGRTNVVNTHGSRTARLMFVGEAPGADEDQQARPFVGRAGQLLTKIIEAMGCKREDVIIGNVNRCRPPANRQPTIEEAEICKPFLLREIAVVRPEVIVVMGNTAMKNLLDTREGITRVRGKFQDYHGIKVMPTFHPAYLLRDPSKKRETWEDMKKVREYLDNSSPKPGVR